MMTLCTKDEQQCKEDSTALCGYDIWEYQTLDSHQYHIHLCRIAENIRNRPNFNDAYEMELYAEYCESMSSDKFEDEMDHYDRCGFYSLILAAHQRRFSDPTSTFAGLKALVCAQRNIKMNKIKIPSASAVDFICHSLLFVDVMSPSKRERFSHLIFEQFIELYVCTEFLSTIRAEFNSNVRCKDYEKNKKCEECDDIRVLNESYLGYLMIFCAENICNELKVISMGNLKKKMFKAYDVHGKQHCEGCVEKEVRQKVKNLKNKKQINSDLIKQQGEMYVNNAFIWIQQNKRCKHDKDKIFAGGYFGTIIHILGKVCFHGQHNYDTANQYLIMSACINESLFCKVLSLKALSNCCYANGQYLIAKKVLNAAFILCNGYFLPSFVEKEYKIKMKKCVQRIKMIRCGYCGKKQVSGSCTGCLKVSYCSKRCQKKAWKREHRTECDKNWHSDRQYFYKLLKNIIFDPIYTR